MGAEAFGNGLNDLVIGQVDVAAATLAHSGAGGFGHLQRGAALEATYLPLLDGGLRGANHGSQGLLHAKMGVALLTERRVRRSRFRLDMPALGARDRYRILFRHRHAKDSDLPG